MTAPDNQSDTAQPTGRSRGRWLSWLPGRGEPQPPKPRVIGEDEERRTVQRARRAGKAEAIQNTSNRLSLLDAALPGLSPIVVGALSLISQEPDAVAHSGGELVSNHKEIRNRVAAETYKAFRGTTLLPSAAYVLSGGSIYVMGAAAAVSAVVTGVGSANDEAIDEGLEGASTKDKVVEATRQVGFLGLGLTLTQGAGYLLEQVTDGEWSAVVQSVSEDLTLGNPYVVAALTATGVVVAGYRGVKNRIQQRKTSSQAASTVEGSASDSAALARAGRHNVPAPDPQVGDVSVTTPGGYSRRLEELRSQAAQIGGGTSQGPRRSQ